MRQTPNQQMPFIAFPNLSRKLQFSTTRHRALAALVGLWSDDGEHQKETKSCGITAAGHPANPIRNHDELNNSDSKPTFKGATFSTLSTTVFSANNILTTTIQAARTKLAILMTRHHPGCVQWVNGKNIDFRGHWLLQTLELKGSVSIIFTMMAPGLVCLFPRIRV